MYDPNRITYIGETDYRNERRRFGIRAEDRAKHVYVIGKTGMGKSTLLENMAVQDIENGEGFAFIDPHGGSAEKLLEYIPEHRMQDVIYFAPFDTDFPISFNVMEDVDPDKRYLVVSGLMSTFKKIWVDAWSARMEYILGNTLAALLEYPDSTLLAVNRMLTDKEYRKLVVENISDPSVASFWKDEFAGYSERYAQEATPAIQNKIGQFTSNPVIRNIVGQSKSSFDMRAIMDNRKILIANLSKGRIGEDNAKLLGGMLITKIYLAAMSRADATPTEMAGLPNFYLFVDEFQSFANESFADILSEARKYKLNLTMAHQYIAQMEDAVKDAVFGNVGTTISFRVGPLDAEVLERIFAPIFNQEDIVGLGRYQMYMSLMINGVGSKPFSAMALPPRPHLESPNVGTVIEYSRSQFAHTRQEVETAIQEWHTPIPSEKDIEHKEYLEKKKAEVLASGGTWIDKETGEVTQGTKQTEPKRTVQRKAPSKRDMVRKKPAPKTNHQKPITKNKTVTISPELQKLIGKLDTPERAVEKKAVTPKKGPEPVSLSHLGGKNKNLDRAAKENSKDALRAALAEATKDTTPSAPAEHAVPPPPAPEEDKMDPRDVLSG